MAATPPGQALQRVCPHCSTIAVTPNETCPWCRRSYRRRVVPWIALLLLVQAAIVLGGVALMLTAFGDAASRELDDQVVSVQDDFSKELDGVSKDLRSQLRSELDARLPAAGTTVTP
jgi:RNA polymerase subunit RPABC4/transcription elongation factor Spt4